MGDRVNEVCQAYDDDHEYSRSYYLHGLAVQMAEGLAEWNHQQIRQELELKPGTGKRYSFGYPACPNLEDHPKLFDILEAQKHTTVKLTEAYQIDPEQSTSAIVMHHPEAKYYSV